MKSAQPCAAFRRCLISLTPSLVLAALIWSGCGKKPVEATSPPTPVSAIPGMTSKNPQEVLAALNNTLDYYNSTKGLEVPFKSVEDFVTAGILEKVPEAPSGMRFAFDPKSGRIVLARQ